MNVGFRGEKLDRSKFLEFKRPSTLQQKRMCKMCILYSNQYGNIYVKKSYPHNRPWRPIG
jgi:hypothetical protein